MYCINCGESVTTAMDKCPTCGLRVSAETADEITRISHASDATLITGAAKADATIISSAPDSAHDTDTQIQTNGNTATDANQHLELGRILGNRYEIREWIGGGGMGSIYAARRIHIGDIVAVKVLRPEVVTDAQSRERFQREARAAAKLHHPNAVVIHDFGQDPDSTTYIVMELLEGRSLREVMNAERPMPPEKTLRILKQACAAIEAAHRLGIIHRDIKPDNIILLDSHDSTEHVKILDFGIAKLLDRTDDPTNTDPTLTQVGTVIGTPTYMSPEQCQGEPLDARSDVYSLGVVLYEMLTGAQPFTAKNSTALVIKHVTEAPPPLTSINPKLSAAVEYVVMKSLAKKPEARQQSALDLSREFEAALNNQVLPGLAPSTDKKKPTGFTYSAEENKAPMTAEAKGDKVIKSGHTMLRWGGLGAVAFLLLSAIGWWMFSAMSKPAVVNVEPTPRGVSGAAAALPVSEEPDPAPEVSATPLVPPTGMVLIVGGDFQMGADESTDIDTPMHPVSVKPFFIDKNEVTNERYKAFLDETQHPAPPAWKDKQFPEGQENYPVTDVTWEDAEAYAKWAKKRLPTEAEWEYAARGTDNRIYTWGKEYQPGLASVTEPPNQDKSDKDKSDKKDGMLYPVGSFPDGKSPAGLLDMIGNVWEWTANDLVAYPGGKLNPKAGYKNLKVIRGGSFKSDPKQATTTFRRGWPGTRADWPPGVTPDYSATGFRCAQDTP